MALRRKILLLVLFLALTVPAPARADWINLTGAENAPNIAEIYIDDDHIRLVLEVYVGDLETFIDLVPDDMLKEGGAGRSPLAGRMRRFSGETFRFVTGDGRKLRAKLKTAEPRLRKKRESPFVGMINPVTRRPVPGPPEDKRVLYAELVYPFSGRPDTLTIIPPIGGRGMAAASIGFIAYHRGVPVVDFRFLSEPSLIRLDWEDPWYSSFEAKSLKRWQQSGIMSFLYIEPYEVRHEVLVRLKDLSTWMDLGLRGDRFIEVDELEPLKKRAGEFFLARDKVAIDGKRLRPILDRTSFVKYTRTRTIFLDRPERLPLDSAMLGVIITYITEGLPQEVTVEWDLFSDRIRKVPVSAEDPAGPFPSFVTPDDNIHKWTNYLKKYEIPQVREVSVADTVPKRKVPLGTMGCLVLLLPVAWQARKRRQQGTSIGKQLGIGALLIAGSLLLYPYTLVSVSGPAIFRGKINKATATNILHSLLKNVYRSFDFREESDVYDRLALSVSGDLLEEIYLQNRKSFEVKQAGGAQARVKEIEVMDVEVKRLGDRPRALLLESKWTATGAVGHWGHIHIRKNRYAANLTIEPVEGAWKIMGLELLEEKRIDTYGQPETGKAPSGS